MVVEYRNYSHLSAITSYDRMAMAVANSSSNTSTNTIKGDNHSDFVASGALAFVVVLGVFGNSLTIYSTLKEKNLRKKNHYYLVFHLAFCDLGTLLVTILFIYPRFFSGSSVIRSNFACKMVNLTQTLFYTAGSSFMTLIAILRYHTVVNPMKAAISRYKVKVFAGLVYISAFILLIPYILVLQFTKLDKCEEKWPHQALNAIYTIILSAIQYFIPVMIITVAYYRIVQTLIKQKEKITSMASANNAVTADDVGTRTNLQRLKHHRNIRTFVTCVSVVICFVVSGFPGHLFAILQYAAEALPRYSTTLEDWTLVVNYLGTCAINPVIYGMLDKRLNAPFKRGLARIKAVLCKNRKLHMVRENFLMNEINVRRQSPENDH